MGATALIEPQFSHVSHSFVLLNTELFVDVWFGV